MTTSAKSAYYAPGLLDTDIAFGSFQVAGVFSGVSIKVRQGFDVVKKTVVHTCKRAFFQVIEHSLSTVWGDDNIGCVERGYFGHSFPRNDGEGDGA